jgi:hypothetical protein
MILSNDLQGHQVQNRQANLPRYRSQLGESLNMLIISVYLTPIWFSSYPQRFRLVSEKSLRYEHQFKGDRHARSIQLFKTQNFKVRLLYLIRPAEPKSTLGN